MQENGNTRNGSEGYDQSQSGGEGGGRSLDPNAAGEMDAGSFGGGNEGARAAGSESAAAGSGETGTIGGPHGGADDIGRSGTGSAMTGQTSILSDEK
jgi:hypothetical protein